MKFFSSLFDRNERLKNYISYRDSNGKLQVRREVPAEEFADALPKVYFLVEGGFMDIRVQDRLENDIQNGLAISYLVDVDEERGEWKRPEERSVEEMKIILPFVKDKLVKADIAYSYILQYSESKGRREIIKGVTESELKTCVSYFDPSDRRAFLPTLCAYWLVDTKRNWPQESEILRVNSVNFSDVNDIHVLPNNIPQSVEEIVVRQNSSLDQQLSQCVKKGSLNCGKFIEVRYEFDRETVIPRSEASATLADALLKGVEKGCSIS